MKYSILRKTVSIGVIVILLFSELSMFNDYFYPIRLLWTQGKIVEIVLSVVVFIWSILGVFLIFFSSQSVIRKYTLPFFTFFYLFNVGSFQVSKAPIDYQQADLIVSYFQWWLGSVIENIGLAVLPLLIILIPVIILVERYPRLSKLSFPKVYYFVPVSAVLLITVVLQYSNGLLDRYPSFFRIPAMFVFAGLSQTYDGKRSEPGYIGSLGEQVEKVVLIVDESIRADILGINGFLRDTTPYLRSLQTDVVNLGVAASSSNCSDYSNLIIRTGLRKKAIPDEAQMSLMQPSIFQFTRMAGYYNVYLDAQSEEEWANLQNFMNEHEAAFIDEIHRVRQKTTYMSDAVAREKLTDLLKKPGKTFIMLNKYGIHFPYFRSYPKDFNIFTPALELGEPMNDREKSLNSYMNGIRWSVDDWFEKLLLESRDFRNYAIIYTSDHGQNIVDDGTLATHCRPRANRFEGIVPMMVYSNDSSILDRVKQYQTINYDKTTHFQIFPTLLGLTGYEEEWVRSQYGASLFEPVNTIPEFFVGDAMGRGSVRQWVSIFPSSSNLD